MATQDDKISNNRRRLFKALSAAPVVATLKSGEALANHSSYQCIAKIPADGPERVISCGPDATSTDDCPTSEDNGYLYQGLWYFDYSGVATNEFPAGTPVAPPPNDDVVGGIIVQVGATYFNLLGPPYPDDLTAEEVTGYVAVDSSTTPPTLNIYNTTDSSLQGPATLWKQAVPGAWGLFAVLVKPIDDGGSYTPAEDATGVQVVGVYPGTEFGGDNDNQMMAGSCWTSITGGNAVPDDWTLSRG